MPAAAPTPEEFRRALSLVPTSVTVVAAQGEQGPSGATANAVTALSLEPLLMLACLHRESRTLRSLGHGGRFAINVLASDQEELARRFSRKDPEPEKWAGVPWRDRDGSPHLRGALVWIGCELRETHPGGDHVIVTGEVRALERGEGTPLLFHRGAFPSLG